MGSGVWLTVLVAVLLVAAMQTCAEPRRVKLWPSGAPGAAGKDGPDDPNEPTMDIYLPAKGKAVTMGVVVLPGGGYGHLALGHEGQQIGEFFNGLGAAAFVVRYRHAPRFHHPVPLGDAQRAVRCARARAGEFGIASSDVGLMGFSAGGHLASSVLTHFDAGKPDANDPVDRVSCRPDFGVLCYPVITLTQEAYCHKGSRQNLLGAGFSAELQKEMSSELKVTKDTPPCFLFATDQDKSVPAENAVLFYLALRQAGVGAELHVFRPGAHGVGLALKDPVLSAWPQLLTAWLKAGGWLKPAAAAPAAK